MIKSTRQVQYAAAASVQHACMQLLQTSCCAATTNYTSIMSANFCVSTVRIYA